MVQTVVQFAILDWGEKNMKMHEIDDNIKQDVTESEKKGLYYYVNKRKKAGTSRDASSPVSYTHLRAHETN
jgi:hypothetical protein